MSCDLMNPYQYSSLQYHHRNIDSHKDVRLQRVGDPGIVKESESADYDYSSSSARHQHTHNMFSHQGMQGTDYSRVSEPVDYHSSQHLAASKLHSEQHLAATKLHSEQQLAATKQDNLAVKQTKLSSLEVKGEKDKDEGRAEYISADCVIFSYFAGDIMDAVNDHFSKALCQESSKECVPLAARGLPPSFWDSTWLGGSPHTFTPTPDLYQEYSDPWQSYMASMSGYSAHGMYSRSYSSLLLHHSRREWMDSNYPSYSYPSMSDGSSGHNAAGSSGGSKELSWF